MVKTNEIKRFIEIFSFSSGYVEIITDKQKVLENFVKKTSSMILEFGHK